MKIMSIFGTRPEAIKLAPVVKALERRQDIFSSRVLVTAQHREMLDQALELFHIEPDIDLDLMRPDQSLFEMGSRLLKGIGRVLEVEKPDFILVQGDTASTFTATLAAFYLKIPVGHVEAGLRTFNKHHPFPEEINRRLTGVLADFHFVPTQRAKENLLNEGVNASSIFHTGNTIIDALNLVRKKSAVSNLPDLHPTDSNRLILVTAHRRENWGGPLENICKALNHLVETYADVEVVFPVHLNPNVRKTVQNYLSRTKKIHLIEPCDYGQFVKLMTKSYLILTDSGGIQEEALSLGKPVLVMRDVTERLESIEYGAATLIGTDTQKIISSASFFLENEMEYEMVKRIANPYGDGKAAQRIVNILAQINGEKSLVAEAELTDSFEIVI